jgi:hypothetical protein
MFKDKGHFVEELKKSIQKDLDARKEELGKADGKGRQFITQDTAAKLAHDQKRQKLEDNIADHEEWLDNNKGHPNFEARSKTLLRAKAELAAHNSR